MREIRSFAGFEELVVAGVIVGVLGAGLLLPVSGEPYEWAQYAAFGAIVPLAALWAGRGTERRAARIALSALGVAGVVAYVWWTRRWGSVPLATAQVLVAAIVTRAPPRLVDLVVAVGSWAAVATLTRSGALRDELGTYVARTDTVGLALTFLGVAWTSAALALARARARRWAAVGLAVAVVPLGLESLRSDYLFDWLSIHHWGVFVAPAEAVRQGGWLLWDVPATYGPLSTLAIASVPTASAWDAFFLLNAAACLASATVLFAVLRTRVGSVLAFALALASVLWLPGHHDLQRGGAVLVTPSAGPFRFGWCQLLLALAAAGARRPTLWAAGCVVWLVGCLWSSESGVYCTVTWLPAYLLLVWQAGPRARWRWMALPPLLASGAVLAVALYYRARLGHGPDWYGYVEAAFGIRGAVAFPMTADGPVAVLVLTGWLIAAAATVAARRRDLTALAPACAAFGFLWSVASYFVGRSHTLVVTSLLPSVLLAGMVAVRGLHAGEGGAVRTAFATVCAAVLLFAAHDRSGWWPRRPIAQRWTAGVEHLRPTWRPAEATGLAKAGVSPDGPVVYYDPNVMPAWPGDPATRRPPQAWLPIQPLTEIIPVSDERRILYVRRFIDRARMGGWLLEDAGALLVPAGGGPWLFDVLAQTHRLERDVRAGALRARLYAYGAAPTEPPAP